jgi:hypothetical protein
MSNPIATGTIQDPAVPMIRLPATFRSRRIQTFADKNTGLESHYDIMDVEGCGCVRHISTYYAIGRRLEICVDGAQYAQVDMPQKPFFGIMHDLTPYVVDTPAYTVIPNYETPNMPGNPNYNLYLPIPFSKSCRIRLYLDEANGEHGVYSMVDWHEYDDDLHLTPFRLFAEHHLYTPAPPRNSSYVVADASGRGFVAGVVLGVKQRNFSDRVWHTSGMSILIDGETDPHVIRGINMEDDFGFSWGINLRQARWIGAPYHKWGGGSDQDGVIFRFFGPDPIAFDSSIAFGSGSRDDDIETVAYYYRIPDSEAASTLTPDRWFVTGLYSGANGWEKFNSPEDVEEIPIGNWEEHYSGRKHFIREVAGNRGWIDFRFSGIDPGLGWDQFVNNSMYAGASLHCDSDREAIVRLYFDDWLILWVNGEKRQALRHDGFETARVPITLRRGRNDFMIKTNNLEHCFNPWVANFIIE